MIAATPSPLILGPLSSGATGPAAQFVAEQSDESLRRLNDSLYLGLAQSGIFEELCGIYDQCSEPNWDGYGANAISVDAYGHAYRFLESLPWGIPKPSVGAEPDGYITLEWHRSPRWTLSVSISPDGDLHYAALLGASKAFGTEPFFGEPPKTILDLIGRVSIA